MYCICADGGTLSKQKDQRYGFGDDERCNSSTIDQCDGFWNSSVSRRPMNTVSNRNSNVAALSKADGGTTIIIDFDQRQGQENARNASSFSFTSSTSTVSMPKRDYFSRRRQSLVEALSNPVTSVRSISPVPIELLNTSYTKLNTSSANGSRPSSSVVPENQDSEHRLYSIDELIRSERDYVTLLSALHEGFLKPAIRQSELFDTRLVRAIFGNLHQLRGLHERLLVDLEIVLKKTPLCLGACLLQHICTRSTFEAYSHYCNNHQRSCRRLSQLYQHDSYRTFFEECRRACRLPTLRLDAFLLRPVQQLCRYPLLLAAVLQRTPKGHQDHKTVSQALQATQQLLTVVNNRRRLFEQLQELARWQKTVADWKGPELLQTSTRLVYSGELLCTCYAVGETVPRWRKRVFVFLFDRLLVTCTKDRIKKQLSFKSRFELDGTNKSCLLRGGAWQLTAPTEGRRLLFKANSKHEAKLWLEALNKERYLVQQTARLPTNDEKMLAIEIARDQDI